MGRLKGLPARLSRPLPRLAPPAKTADPFYLSSEWRALKARRRLDPDYYEAQRRLKPGEWLVLDHIVERRDGGAELDPANTQWLTSSEHNAKTAQERAKRAQRRS
jgi:5-methylcytosine-specific restriction protein A